MKADDTGMEISRINTEDLIKEAGSNFMYSISSKGEKFEGLHGLFEKLNVISSLKYEHKENIGNMIICKNNHENIKMDFTFSDPIPLSNYRKVRKLLELTSQQCKLVTDSYLIYGLGHEIGEYNPINEDIFVVNFTGHYQWELLHDNKHLIKTTYNQPFLPTLEFNRAKFFSDMKRIFNSIDDVNVLGLYNIVISLIKNRNGAILVIAKDAKKESDRLKNQSIVLENSLLMKIK